MTDINNNPSNDMDDTSQGSQTTDDTTSPMADLTAHISYLTVLLRRTDMLRGHGRRGFGGEIRSGQGRVLGILALQSPLTQKNLAFMLGVRPQSLSELVAKLESKGLVMRQRDESDRRSFLIELTDAGREAASEIDSMTAEDPFDVLSDEERTTFADLTQKVISSIEERFPDLNNHGGPRGPEGWGGPGFGPGFGPGQGHGRGHGFGPQRRRGRHPDGEMEPRDHGADFRESEGFGAQTSYRGDHSFSNSRDAQGTQEAQEAQNAWGTQRSGMFDSSEGFRGRMYRMRELGRGLNRGFRPRFA